MRILFTYMGGSGHFAPLAPIAQAAQARGHEVAFVALPGTAAQVRAAGFDDFVSEPTPEYQAARAAMHARANLLPTIAEREDLLFRDGFAGIHARQQVGHVRRACAAWHPDLIVREEADFGSVIAAELLGLPYVTLLIIAAGSLVRHDLIVGALNDLRAEFGLPTDPDLAMLRRNLVLCPFPPSFRDPGFPLPEHTLMLGPLGLKPAVEEALPAWIADLPDLPTVYFSLGTEFNVERRDIFAPVIEGLRDLPINLIVTVGRNLDPAEFGAQPPNVHIERFVTQSLLLPHCDLVVTHGGSGTVMGALAHGIPLIVIPLGADQPQNAERCAALGVGIAIPDTAVTPATVLAAAETVLADLSYRARANQLRDEIAAAPGPEYVVPLLEQYVPTKKRSAPAGEHRAI